MTATKPDASCEQNLEAHLLTIRAELDARIDRYLRTRQPCLFWFASYPGCSREQLPELHQQGFHNYPAAPVSVGARPFFLEAVLGCPLPVVDGPPGSFFHTWPEPLLTSLGEVGAFRADVSRSPVWQEELAKPAFQPWCAAGPGTAPVVFPGASPLDCACTLCGAERLFLWMMDGAPEVAHLLEVITDAFLAMRSDLAGRGLRLVNGYGFPCAYINDLQLAYLNPALIRHYLLPCYRRVAKACGGLLLALHSFDPELVQEVLRDDGIVGCAFDKRLPLETIRAFPADKLFLIANYAYDDALEQPTFRDGLYWNPIVQSYSREIDRVFQVLGDRFSFLTLIERPSLDDVRRTRERLLACCRTRKAEL